MNQIILLKMTFFKVKYKHHFKWSICFQLHAIDIIITAAGWNAGCMSEQQSQWYKLYYINIILLIYGRDKDISFVWSAPIKCRTDWYQVDRSVRCSTTDFFILFAAINPAIHRKNLNTKFFSWNTTFGHIIYMMWCISWEASIYQKCALKNNWYGYTLYFYMMSKLLDHMNYVCIYTMYMYVVTIMPDLECE